MTGITDAPWLAALSSRWALADGDPYVKIRQEFPSGAVFFPLLTCETPRLSSSSTSSGVCGGAAALWQAAPLAWVALYGGSMPTKNSPGVPPSRP